LILSLLVIYSQFGGGAVIVALFIFPATLALLPLYTLFAFGSWTLLLVNYGSMLAAWILYNLAEVMEKSPEFVGEKPVSIPTIVEPVQQDNGVRTMLIWIFIGLGILFLFAIFASPQSSPAIVSTPTVRPSIVPTNTHFVRATRTPQPASLRACVTNSTIRIRNGPGTEYETVDGMASGTCMSILGRNQDSTWVYMVSEDNRQGWVSAPLLTIEGDLAKISVRSTSETLSIAPTASIRPTSTPKPLVRATNTLQPLPSRSMVLCSEAPLGERVSCQLPQAYCDYLPDVNGNPTFCNDRPYPSNDFQMVVWGEDWSALDGACIVISGYVEAYNGRLQIEALSPSQVSFCE
jgi:uncharacterized protein YraI